MIRHLAVVVAAAVILNPGGLHGQASHPLVGKWTIEFVRGQRMEDGATTPIMGTGDLVVSAQGDSFVATLTVGPRPDGSVPPPAVMVGRAGAGGVTFVHKATAQLNMNGEARTVDAITTWILRVSGDAMEGTMARELPGLMIEMPMEPAPVKGTRAK
jgi:hypothetical protein